MKKYLVGLFVLLGMIGLSGCGETEEQTETGEIKVIASFYPMYDFTKNIVGDEGTVELMIPAGTEAHDYEPSARNLADIQDADVFVYNNENMETWVPEIEGTLADGDVQVVKATEGMILLPGDEAGHDHSHDAAGHEGHSHELDPHVWLAPSLAIKEVAAIRDQLMAAYPEKAQAFEENAAAYLEKLTALDEAYQDQLTNATQKTFVTQHSAFGYLALEYGLNQVPITGLSANEEPSASRLAELKEFVLEQELQYIYFEENATEAVARTLAEETGVELLVLNPLEGLTKEQQAAGEDYISVMEENLTALSKTINNERTSTLPTVEKEQTVYNGYFADSDVSDRPLSDWQGNWQSVYPYLEDGSLDQVMAYKAKLDSSKTLDEYFAYYQTGYQTTINEIEITEDTMSFTDEDGQTVSSEYQYTGYQILNYAAGNRGVRYLFEALDDSSGAFKYVQFSDHDITSTKAAHFHIYFGNDSQEALLTEMNHWPTYYPEDLSGFEIAQEMMAH